MKAWPTSLKGAAQGRASDETTLALHEKPALPSWGIFFFFLSFFLYFYL